MSAEADEKRMALAVETAPRAVLLNSVVDELQRAWRSPREGYVYDWQVHMLDELREWASQPANEGEAVTEMTLTPRGHQTTRTDRAVEALRLANDSTASAQEVVDRATAYLEFLSKAANTTATG